MEVRSRLAAGCPAVTEAVFRSGCLFSGALDITYLLHYSQAVLTVLIKELNPDFDIVVLASAPGDASAGFQTGIKGWQADVYLCPRFNRLTRSITEAAEADIFEQLTFPCRFLRGRNFYRYFGRLSDKCSHFAGISVYNLSCLGILSIAGR